MKNLALSRIQQMKPYNPPLSGRSNYKGLLLDFNERTEVSQSVQRGLEKFVRSQKAQVYPEYFDLEAKIANYAGVEPDQIMVVNGTDQGIDVIFRTFTEKGDKVVIPAPTFAMYAQCASVNGNEIVSPLYEKDSLAFPFQEVLRVCDEKPKLVIITNPNSPTGTLLPVSDIEEIAKLAKDSIVYVDEAYYEFSKTTAVGLIKKYPNVIVSRTFSKAFGLAGLRIGYVIADSQYIAEMLKVRGPYDVNAAAYYAAEAALSDASNTERYVREVIDKAKPFTEEFFTKNSVPFWPSAGNFILFRPGNSDEVLQTLERSGIRVRPQEKQNIEGTLRLTIGTLPQMKRFAQIYETAVLKKPEKYALLDRDGTLIFEPQDTYQIDSLQKLQILNGVIEGLQALVVQGYRLAIISNQDGLGTASFSTKDFEVPQAAMLKTFADAGITFDQIFICPHLPEDNCNCRKPKIGMLTEFLQETTINRERSFVCGDRKSDEGLAKNLGLKFVPMPTNGNFYDAIKDLERRKK